MTHHAMRRHDRQTTDAETWDILARGHYCVLSTVDADGTPYGVPVSYAIQGREVVIHTTAQDGHLLENFGRDPRVCATVVATAQAFLEDPGISEAYESVIALGNHPPRDRPRGTQADSRGPLSPLRHEPRGRRRCHHEGRRRPHRHLGSFPGRTLWQTSNHPRPIAICFSSSS